MCRLSPHISKGFHGVERARARALQEKKAEMVVEIFSVPGEVAGGSAFGRAAGLRRNHYVLLWASRAHPTRYNSKNIHLTSI